jgi:hypothetical protein
VDRCSVWAAGRKPRPAGRTLHPLNIRACFGGLTAINLSCYSYRWMKHDIRWNPELQEWFCARCGRTSDHVVHEDAQTEMELFECEPPAAEVEPA